jgi:hypothetical protein
MVSSDFNTNMLQQFSTMQPQGIRADPGGRPFCVLPALNAGIFSSLDTPGWFNAKITSHALAKGGGGFKGMFSNCVVSMDTIAQWNTHDLGRVSATIEAPQIEAPHISGMPIEGAHISGFLIEAARIEAPHISAPSGIGQAAHNLG